MTSILITDDEKDIRDLIGDILKDEGYAVRLASNSDECMAEINAEPPALMILDIWLKDSRMDGIDILKTVKRDNPDIPIVIISGHGNIEIAVAAIKQLKWTGLPASRDALIVRLWDEGQLQKWVRVHKLTRNVPLPIGRMQVA